MTDPHDRGRRLDASGILHDAYAQFRTFERARDGRMIAGVCTGIGQRLEIDPVVVRVVIAVLALVSGAGLVLYGAAWLLLPEEGRERSIAHRLFGRDGDDESSGPIVVGVGAIVALVAMSMLPWGESWWGPVLVAGIIAGLVALARRRPDDSLDALTAYHSGPGDAASAETPETTGPVATGTAPSEPVTAAAAGPRAHSAAAPDRPATEPVREPTARAATSHDPTSDEPISDDPTSAQPPSSEPDSVTRPVEPSSTLGATAGTTGPAVGSAAESILGTTGKSAARATGGTTETVPAAPPRSWTQHAATPPPPSFWEQPDPLGLETEPEPAPAPAPAPEPVVRPEPKGPRSLLFPVTVGLALLALFVLAAISGAGETVPLVMWAAVPLGIVGLGVLVGTWYGRSGGLIGIGILLALALVPLGVVDAVSPRGASWGGPESLGDRLVEPTTVEDIRSAYNHGAGSFVLDVTRVPFTDRDDVEVQLNTGMGDVTVLVPDELDVRVTGDIGLGDAEFFGASANEYPGHDFDVSDEGSDGPGGGRLTLRINHGLGKVEVTRTPAVFDDPTPGKGPDAEQPNEPNERPEGER